MDTLKLAGVLTSYQVYDTNGEKGLDAKEATLISDNELAHLLEDALDEKGEPETNGHNAFFNSLPVERIARLFAGGEEGVLKPISQEYWQMFAAQDLPKVTQFLEDLVYQGEYSPSPFLVNSIAIPGEELADRFLLSGAVTLQQWDTIFDSLKESQPAYVFGRTHFDYREGAEEGDVALIDKAELYDLNGDGLFEREEIKDYEADKDIAAIGPAIFSGIINDSSFKTRVTAHYVTGGLSAHGLGIGLAVLSVASPSALNVKFKIDPKGVKKGLEAIADREGAIAFAMIVNTVFFSLDDNNLPALHDMTQEIVTSAKAKAEALEAAEAKKPYQIEGFKNVNEDNFDPVVLKAKKAVLVIFGDSGCPSCREVKEDFKKVAKKYSADVDMVVVDAEANVKLADAWHIEHVPAFRFFNNGQLASQDESPQLLYRLSDLMELTVGENTR